MPIVARWWCRNPMAWFLLVALLLLVGSIGVPLLAAQRTTRVEERAGHVAHLLAEATREFRERLTGSDVEPVLASFHALAVRDRVFVADLETVDPPLPGTLLTLRNKHYLFHLAESPPDPQAIVGRDASSAYEVAAWPRSAVGPAHSVFFLADDAPPAYTRNLGAGYVGDGPRRLLPGRCHLRSRDAFVSVRSYRGYDDERWIVYVLPGR